MSLDALMDDAIRSAPAQGELIEMTTTGAKTGRLRPIEIVLHSFEGVSPTRSSTIRTSVGTRYVGRMSAGDTTRISSMRSRRNAFVRAGGAVRRIVPSA